MKFSSRVCVQEPERRPGAPGGQRGRGHSRTGASQNGANSLKVPVGVRGALPRFLPARPGLGALPGGDRSALLHARPWPGLRDGRTDGRTEGGMSGRTERVFAVSGG